LKHDLKRLRLNLSRSKQKHQSLLSFLLQSLLRGLLRDPLRDLLIDLWAPSNRNRALLINLQANRVRHSVLPLAELDLTTAHGLPINRAKLALHHLEEAITAAADIVRDRREEPLQAFPKDTNLDLPALPLTQAAADSVLVLLAVPAVEHLAGIVQGLLAVPEDLVQAADIVPVHQWIV
jgi:hypothetical protein